MRKWLKIIAAAIIVILLILQIPIFRPSKNVTKTDPEYAITAKYDVPTDLLTIFKKSCYDCHSNNTRYPWYYHIQPVSWWMNSHIQNGKEHLNFSEFANYSPYTAAHKFYEIHKEMTRKEMPLKSYLLQHKPAKLTEEQFQKIASWAKKMQIQTIIRLDSAHGKTHSPGDSESSDE
jgi:hypothetical protein